MTEFLHLPAMEPVPATENELGLTSDEQAVMDALLSALKHFCDLPKQHPNETADFIEGIHILQGLLALRVVRRSYRIGWPTYGSGDASHSL